MLIILLGLILVRPFISSLAFPDANLIYASLLLGFLGIYILLKGISIKEDKLKVAVFLLLAALTFSLIFHYNKTASPLELTKYIIGIMFFLVCSSLPNSAKNKVILSIIIAAVLISFLAIHQYFFGFRSLADYIIKEKISDPFFLEYIRQKRVFFPFITPNILGGYLAMIIPLALAYKNKAWIIIPMFIALLMTKSVAALLSLSIGYIIYLYLTDKIKEKGVLILLGLLVITSAIFIFIVWEQAQKTYLRTSFSTTMRLIYWQDTLKLIMAYPLTGVGPGNFNLILSRYSHNSYLQFWAETGIWGIGSLFWLIIVALKLNLKALKASPDKIMAAAIIYSISVFLINNFLDFSFFLPEVSLIWWGILGLLLSGELTLEKNPQVA